MSQTATQEQQAQHRSTFRVGDIVKLTRNFDLEDTSQRLAGSVGRVTLVDDSEVAVDFPAVERIDFAHEERALLELLPLPSGAEELEPVERLARLLYDGSLLPSVFLSYVHLPSHIEQQLKMQAEFLLQHGVMLV